jgi:hypothetical protein
MRHVSPAFLFLVAAGLVSAADPPKKSDEPTEFKDVKVLALTDLKVGNAGTMPAGMVVSSIIDGENMVVKVTTTLTTGGGRTPVKVTLIDHYLVVRGIPTKDLAEKSAVDASKDNGKTPVYWGVVGTEKTTRGTLFVVRTVPQPKGEGVLKAEPAKPVEPVKKPEPLPRATVTPAKDEPALLGSAQYIVATAKKEPDQRAKWLKDGHLKEITTPVEVEVVARDKEYSKVKLDGKEWVVESRWLSEEKK